MHNQVQNFKGDETELKMRASAEPAFDVVDTALDDFYENGGECSPFLLMLYDEGRAPYSNRIGRDVFVSFIKRALDNFPFVGNFETYNFILREIFGAESDIIFTVPAPGKLSISVNAVADAAFEFVARELEDGQYSFFTIGTLDGVDDIVFRGVSGIESEAELKLLFSELIPGGIVPEIFLEFFTKFSFIGEDGDGVFDVITDLGDEIIFVEIGG